MTRNLHISYELRAPEKNYDELIEAIKSLGVCTKIHKSFWFVSCTIAPKEVCDLLWKHMDSSDTLYVADTSSNAAAWKNLKRSTNDLIRNHWAH
ncbi:CRISPR-associated protein Cas2 [uncultured Cohaesibacter sp.]|uniref:CRISPR-associated protein Cas2 n=1 Tax=uncultured Cohaesibacter sp. TaxID=1002546 RepID=UPI002AAAE7A6|nr:CRISPR-associated protein Cas2 [uncultured Cohaesibacter sp.]